jgi:hypothetical protein
VKTYTGGSSVITSARDGKREEVKREAEAAPSSLSLNSKTICLLADDAKEMPPTVTVSASVLFCISAVTVFVQCKHIRILKILKN